MSLHTPLTVQTREAWFDHGQETVTSIHTIDGTHIAESIHGSDEAPIREMVRRVNLFDQMLEALKDAQQSFEARGATDNHGYWIVLEAVNAAETQ